jgi:hypothetical protein
MGDGQVNGVAILDAIPDGELNTARRLKEDLIDLSLNTADGLQVQYVRVHTLADLEAGISSLVDDARNNGLKPWLHLEGHGSADETGFQVADGAHCSWDYLKQLITPLNVATGLNLILILATCFGGSFARAIQTVDRAPVLGLLGPKREVKTGQIEIGFIEFYRSFFESSSLKKAIEALNATAPGNLYYRTSAQQFFYAVWAGYKNILCTPQEIDNRAKRMFREAKAKQLPRTPSIGQLKRLIRGNEKEFFEKYRDIYFMYDLDDTNRIRFPVTYKEAEAYASR